MAMQQAKRLWVLYGGLTDENKAAFIERIIPIVEGAQMAVGQLVAGYIAQSATADNTPVTMRAPTREQVTGLRGLPTGEVYERPIIEARTQIANGADYRTAMLAAGRRARTLISADVMLAQRETMGLAVDQQDGVIGYRRTLSGKSCMFCATASTQRYTRINKMALHDHCDCGIAEIKADRDPGQIINSELLNRLKQRGPEYWKSKGFVDNEGNPIEPGSTATPVSVKEHGELGPVLVNSNHHFDRAA